MEEVILFGASNLGKKAMQELEDKYKILSFCDNDKSKWGKKINNVSIISIYDAIKLNVKIIITSTYYIEITKQLMDNKLKDIEIYFTNDNGYYLEKTTKIDIKKVEESSANVLIIISFYSIYIHEFIKHMNKFDNLRFDIATRDKKYLEKLNDYVENIYYYNNYDNLNEVISYGNYEIIHLHYMEQVYSALSHSIDMFCEKFIITYWGSDYYRESKSGILKVKELLNIADNITFDNSYMLKEFCTEIGEEFFNKSIIRRFGLTQLDYINKHYSSYGKRNIGNKCNIICGYNARKEQNHIPLLKELLKLPICFKEKLHLIIPMTYGNSDAEYIIKVKELLKELSIDFTILKEFLDFTQMAELIEITDIMINVQTTDSLSATMLENLYAGNIVIAGGWLPYSELRDRDIYFTSIDKIEEINLRLMEIVENLELEKDKYINNREKIYNLSSWERNSKKWLQLYYNEME